CSSASDAWSAACRPGPTRASLGAAMSGATSWNSELPSGRNPFWIKDEALADLGLHVGDAVSVDTRREPADGELALVEVETDDLADRLVRRYFAEAGDRVRLVAA